MKALLQQSFNGLSVRVFGTSENPLFVAADVCRILEIANPRDAVSSLEDDEKADVGITDASSNGVTQRRTVNAVTESGLYALIFKSRKPEAKAFRKWVTGEVLPAIRKTGNYAVQRTEPELPDTGPLFRLMGKLRQKGLSADMAAQIANDMLREQAIQRRFERHGTKQKKLSAPKPEKLDLAPVMLEIIRAGVSWGPEIIAKFTERTGVQKTTAYEILHGLRASGKVIGPQNYTVPQGEGEL